MKRKKVSLLLAIVMTALALTACALGGTTRAIVENQVEAIEEPEVSAEKTDEIIEEAEEAVEEIDEVEEADSETYTKPLTDSREPILSEEVMENIVWDGDLLPYLEYDWANEDGLWLGSLSDSYTEFILADLNEDGQRELILTEYDWRAPGITHIYTVIDGEVVCCGETLASTVRYDVDENIQANPYFPEEIFDVYKDSDGKYQLISYGYGNIHAGSSAYSLFETAYDGEQVTFVPAFGMMLSSYQESYHSYWVEENGEDWDEAVGGLYTLNPKGISDWESIKWNKAVGDDESFTALTQILSEQYSDYEKVDVTFQHSPYLVGTGTWANYEEDQDAIKYNIQAGLAIAAGLD